MPESENGRGKAEGSSPPERAHTDQNNAKENADGDKKPRQDKNGKEDASQQDKIGKEDASQQDKNGKEDASKQDKNGKEDASQQDKNGQDDTKDKSNSQQKEKAKTRTFFETFPSNRGTFLAADVANLLTTGLTVDQQNVLGNFLASVAALILYKAARDSLDE